METQKIYAFNGHKFLPYIDVSLFNKKLKQDLDIEEDSKKYGFENLYENLILKYTEQKKDIDLIFFDMIFYGRLTNLYIHKIKIVSPPTKTLFLKRVQNIIDDLKVNVADAVQPSMTSNGFYIMDILNISKVGAGFIAGFDYKEQKGKLERVRFLVGKNLMRKHNIDGKFVLKAEYLLGAIEVDFLKKQILVMHKHTTNIQNSENSEIDPTSFYEFLKTNILDKLGLELINDYEKDQEGMSILCKYLFETLIKKDKALIESSIKSEAITFRKKAFSLLPKTKLPITDYKKKDFQKKVTCLLLGEYILSNYTENDICRKASDLKLLGFPTKISYENLYSDKSSTGTSRANKSIASVETIYSLLTDFENTSQLRKWSMAWFTNPSDKKNIDTIQTSIEITKKYFKVKFGAYRHLDEEIIHHVVDNLNSYRNYKF